jgi:hypothetical protein
MKKSPLKAVLFQSTERVPAFQKKMSEYGIDCTLLDFESLDWLDFDFSDIDMAIYYSKFKYTSDHPSALHDVYDNLMHIVSEYPNLKIYPCPNIIQYYNDKYKQFLFLRKHDYPIPETIPLFSRQSMEVAEERLGYPMVVKNRHGAGGGSVFRVFNRKELEQLYNISTLNLFNAGTLKYYAKMIGKREFFWHLIRNKQAQYPFLTPPLLAQKFLKIDRDLKTVIGNFKIVEGHWRYQATKSMWKMNIDDGGTGVWEKISKDAIDLSERLARETKASWINLDLIRSNGQFFITEFSPIWHHYAYKEKPDFIYRDDYNVDVPLEVSLDLERIILESLIDAVRQ